jgi:type IV secretion system protein VirB8
MLEQHYKDVSSFQEARARSARHLSKGLIVGLCVAMMGNLGQAWTIASLLPLTKLVPVSFDAAHNNGQSRDPGGIVGIRE